MASSAEVRALRRPSVRLPQEKRVADIMAAARQVVAEKGYENALMSEIAERAGIVEGTLYRYFENKRDLLTKVVDDWFEEVLSIDSGVASIRGTWNKVRHLTWRALCAVRSQPALSRYMLLEIRRDPDYRSTRSFELNRRFTAEFSEVFITYLLARNSRVEEDLVDQLFNSSERRLARVLLLLANFGKEGRPEPILAKISQETLAEMIGTTRARVSFFMNKFRKLGFIEYNGKLEVHTSLLNMILNDNPEIKKTNS